MALRIAQRPRHGAEGTIRLVAFGTTSLDCGHWMEEMPDETNRAIPGRLNQQGTAQTTKGPGSLPAFSIWTDPIPIHLSAVALGFPPFQGQTRYASLRLPAA